MMIGCLMKKMFLSVRLLMSLVLFAGTHVYAQNENGFLSLLEAAKTRDVDTVNTLIRTRVDVNDTALMWAAREGHTEIVQVFIQARVNVDAQSSFGIALWAAREGHTETVQALLAAGADVINASDSFGETPLMLAATNGHIETVQALIKAGADVNAPSSFGTTPLMWAARNGHTETVQVLIKAGANVNALNRYEETPLRIAAQEGHAEIVQALIDAGANVKWLRHPCKDSWRDAIDVGYQYASYRSCSNFSCQQ